MMDDINSFEWHFKYFYNQYVITYGRHNVSSYDFQCLIRACSATGSGNFWMVNNNTRQSLSYIYGSMILGKNI